MYILTYNDRPLDSGLHLIGNIIPSDWSYCEGQDFKPPPASFNPKCIWYTTYSDPALAMFYSDRTVQMRIPAYLPLQAEGLDYFSRRWNPQGASPITRNTDFAKDVWHIKSGTDMGTYYSYQDSNGYFHHYVLNPGQLWVTRGWSGSTDFIGRNMWNHGDSLYNSNGNSHWLFNASERRWYTTSWSGLSSFYGYNVWHDNGNTYVYSGGYHYKLTGSPLRWSLKTWYGFDGISTFNPKYIWHRDNETYYSYGNYHYLLNSSTSTWNRVYFDASFYGDEVWDIEDRGIYTGLHWYFAGVDKRILFKDTTYPYNFISYNNT